MNSLSNKAINSPYTELGEAESDANGFDNTYTLQEPENANDNSWNRQAIESESAYFDDQAESTAPEVEDAEYYEEESYGSGFETEFDTVYEQQEFTDTQYAPEVRSPLSRESRAAEPLLSLEVEQMIVREKLRQGITDEEELTDSIFFNRYPYLQGEQMYEQSEFVEDEWWNVFKSVVKPVRRFFGSSSSSTAGSTATPTQPSTPAPNIDRAKASRLNMRYSARLGWNQYMSKINRLLNTSYANPGSSTLAVAAARWQRSKGMSDIDGIIGPNTWRRMKDALGIGSSSSIPTPVAPTPSGGSSLGARAASIAIREWERWSRGRKKEGDASMRATITDYWRSGVRWLPSKSSWWSTVPWSAAFISWVMRKAGAGGSFKYSARHTVYVGQAKRNRVSGSSNPFKAYRISEIAPRIGDLVCIERSGSGVNYDNVDRGSYASHCDIVVAVHSSYVETIGGNVSNSVYRKRVPVDSSGKVAKSGYYAIVRVE